MHKLLITFALIATIGTRAGDVWLQMKVSAGFLQKVFQRLIL